MAKRVNSAAVVFLSIVTATPGYAAPVVSGGGTITPATRRCERAAAEFMNDAALKYGRYDEAMAYAARASSQGDIAQAADGGTVGRLGDAVGVRFEDGVQAAGRCATAPARSARRLETDTRQIDAMLALMLTINRRDQDRMSPSGTEKVAGLNGVR